MTVSGRWLAVAGALLAVALAARVGVVVLTPNVVAANDAADYIQHAESIAAGNGYPPSTISPGGETAYRPPGWPHMLGAAFAIAGDGLTEARIANAVVGTALVALAGLVAFQLWGAAVGLVALGVAAVYPPLVVGSAGALSEPLFAALVLAALAAVLRFRHVRALRWAALAGLLAGLAILTRANGVVLMLPLAVAAWRSPLRSWGAVRAPAVVVACAALAVAPWTIRNALTLDELIPVAAQGGITLAGTYNETSRTDSRFPAAWRVPNADPAYARLIERTRDRGEPAVNDALGDAAREHARDHPGYVAEVIWRNSLRVLGLGGAEYNDLATVSELGLGPRWSDFATYGFFAFAALALLGAFTRAARRAPWWVWAVPLLTVLAIVAITASQRFRYPADPFIAMLAALALDAALARRRAARVPRHAPSQPASPAPSAPS
jgi:4-amino-4-deoxy-L-arabinose transferase-like glycosyltransferase